MKYKEISVFTTEAGLDAVCARFSMLGMEQLEIVQGREEIADFLQKSAKYWDFADMDELCAAEPCVRHILTMMTRRTLPLPRLKHRLRS